MANSKVIYYGRTLIDLTNDTVDKTTLVKGIKAHDKSGTQITGELELPSGTKTITENGTYDVKSYASVSVEVPPSGVKVYKHTVTLTAVKVSRENSSSTTGTIISTFVLYSTTLNSSIAGEYNESNWDNLLDSLRSCFNAIDGRVYTINDTYTYKAITVQGSYNGSASYYTIGTDNGQLYFTNATTPPKEGASNQIGVYILWTGAYTTGNGYTSMHNWYVLKNFSGGNVIVTDVVTEL